MNFKSEIKQYVSQLKTNSGNTAGIQEQTRTQNILNEFCDNHMWEIFKAWPDESDYDAFRSNIDKTDNPKFATEYINRVKKFFAWLTLQMLETSKLNDDECMQCFTVLECADLGISMNGVVTMLKGIYERITEDNEADRTYHNINASERDFLIGYTGGDTHTGLSYLHTYDLNSLTVVDTEKARKYFFEWLKRADYRCGGTYDPFMSFNFKKQYQYAISIIEERLSILKAKNPITIDFDASSTATQSIYENRQHNLFEADDTATVPIEPKIITDNTLHTNNSVQATIGFETLQEANPPAHVEETAKPAPIRKKPGRKALNTVNGSRKSEKLMIYFTPKLNSLLRAWCDLKGISYVSYITALIENDLHSKEDKINAFLKMRSEL